MVSGAWFEKSLMEMRWRVGRKVGRTIYAMVGPEPSDDDILIGMMDSVALAMDAVGAHNTRLNRVKGRL